MTIWINGGVIIRYLKESDGLVDRIGSSANTLANAVLAQSDRMNQMASQNYDNNRPETIVRTRGIQ